MIFDILQIDARCRMRDDRKLGSLLAFTRQFSVPLESTDVGGAILVMQVVESTRGAKSAARNCPKIRFSTPFVASRMGEGPQTRSADCGVRNPPRDLGGYVQGGQKRTAGRFGPVWAMQKRP